MASTHYFTFGFNHTHPQTGERLKDYWVEIVADSNAKAMQKMWELFGSRWGCHYCEKQFLNMYSHFPKGCLARYEAD